MRFRTDIPDTSVIIRRVCFRTDAERNAADFAGTQDVVKGAWVIDEGRGYRQTGKQKYMSVGIR